MSRILQAKMDSQHPAKIDSQPRARVNSPPQAWRMVAEAHHAPPATGDADDCLAKMLNNVEDEPIWMKKYQPDDSTPPRLDTILGARQRSRQTPITSFTFKQSLDEQRSGMDLYAAQALKQRELANIAKDMSSSSLATRTPRHTRRTQSALAEPDDSMMSPKRLKNVADIATYFGKGQRADEKLNILENNANNNTVCLPTACDILTALPAINAQPYQQMSGQALNSAQPIGSQMSGQVIEKWVPEPIKTKNSQMIQNPEKGGHLEE